MYICISYDTDLMALEEVTGFVKRWYDFVAKHKNLKIELRTKSASIKVFKDLKPNPNFVIAWTISPKKFAQEHERGTVPFEMRVKSAKTLIDSGWTVRICFDPMIKIENFYEIYGEMVRETFKEIDSKKILDVSIGTFRISKEYMKRMKNNRKNSLILNYPFQCQDGVYSYPLDENSKMLEYMKKLILEYVEESKIFI